MSADPGAGAADNGDADLAVRLARQVQELGFDTARLVIGRFTDMFEQFRSASASATEANPLTWLQTWFDDGAPEGKGAADLILPEVEAGGRCSGQVWLHNPTPSGVSDLRLWTPGLATHDGAMIDAPALTFAPAVIDRLDPDTSVAILLSVEISPDAEPGTYHGMLLVRGVPDCKFPLTLNVVGQGEP